MDRFLRRIVRWSAAAVIGASALAAQSAVIENSVVLEAVPGHPGLPTGYEQAFTMRLGTGSWPFPYIDLFVDEDVLQRSYASITAGPSYLTYIQNLKVVEFDPLRSGEISERTLNDGSLRSFVEITAFTAGKDQTFQVAPLSPTGLSPDIFLGFSYSDAQGQNPAYGWAQLRFTPSAGLTVVNSALTVSDAGIYAFTNETIPAVPEASTWAMLILGLVGIAGVTGSRKGRCLSPSV